MGGSAPRPRGTPTAGADGARSRPGSACQILRNPSEAVAPSLDYVERVNRVLDHVRRHLDEPLRQLGTYKVAVRVAPEMISEVTVAVEPKG